MKNTILYFYLFNTLFLFSQTNKVVLKYQEYTSINDSLAVVNGVAENEYYASKCDDKFDFEYRYCVFGMLSNYKNCKALYLTHWCRPIKIYIDKSIDKKVKNEFVKFINNFPEAPLNIKIVNTIGDSNYLVKLTDKKLELKYSEEIDNSFYQGISYELNTDKNNKFSNCKLLVNSNQITDKNIQLKKMKQFFYQSLGSFIAQDDIPTDSMLSVNYINNDIMCEFDKKILNHHYQLYNKNPIDVTIYNKIQKQLNANKELKKDVISKINLQ